MLNNKNIVFGTEHISGEEGVDLCRFVWDIGYRIFDTALAYGNFSAVSKGLPFSDKRCEFSLTSKITQQHIVRTSVRISVETILKELNTDYVDYLFIHAPKGVDHEKALCHLFELKQEQKIKHVGVSNYTLTHLQYLERLNLFPDAIQIEIHPFLQEVELVSFCQKRGTIVMGHSAFANGIIFKDYFLSCLANEMKCSVGELVLQWNIARGIIPIISSKNRSHLQSNVCPKVSGFSSELIIKVREFDRNMRICNNPEWAEFDCKRSVLSVIPKHLK